MDKEWIVQDVDLGCDGAYFGYHELVRCKDCKHRVLNENYGKAIWELKAVCELDTGDLDELGRYAEYDDWFCADGERKDGNFDG